jgi:predicted nucleic acid-binding protein
MPDASGWDRPRIVGQGQLSDRSQAARRMEPLEIEDLPDQALLVDLDADIAESAACLRTSLRLKLADAVQAASALAINAAALVTHDRDFSRARSLRVIS